MSRESGPASDARFIETYAAIAQSNRERLRQLDAVLSAFQSAGRSVLLLKGADLLGRAYGGVLGLRPMDDVDLLFQRDDGPHLERILLARGFRSLIDGNPSYVGPDRILALDMISEIWYLPDIQAVWRRAVPRRVAGRIRPALHPEDALIYQTAYQTIHRGRLSPQMALDLAALLDAEGQFIDWRSVVEQVAACHLDVPVYYGLAYARDTAGAAIPRWVLQALEPLAPQRRTARLYQRLATGPGLPELGHFLLVFSRPGWNNKVRALWQTFFPSRDFLLWRYRATTRWDRLRIRLGRPACLLFKGGLLASRIGYRLLRTCLASPGAGRKSASFRWPS